MQRPDSLAYAAELPALASDLVDTLTLLDPAAVAVAMPTLVAEGKTIPLPYAGGEPWIDSDWLSWFDDTDGYAADAADAAAATTVATVMVASELTVGAILDGSGSESSTTSTVPTLGTAFTAPAALPGDLPFYGYGAEAVAYNVAIAGDVMSAEFFFTLDEVLPVESGVIASDGEGLLTTQSSSLIRVTNMRADPRFAGIDGSGFSVVIVDTGADLNHPAFGPDSNGDGVANRIVFQYDFSGSNDGNATDTKGHGTHVAGTIGSQHSSYLGMAPGVNLIILKVFPDNSDSASSLDIEEAAQWVIANAATYNIVAVNFSLGSGNFNSAQSTYLHNEFQSFLNLGIAPVVATGNSFFGLNSAPGVGQPASDSFAWGVGAVYDANLGQVSFQSGATDFTTGPDRITSFTQRTTVAGLVDIFAPGGAITNAYLGDSTATLYGTSMAAPHIAGIVALAQEYAVQLSGSRLPVSTLLSLMRSSAVTIVDGDDENDNVTNTGGSFPRVDVFALMEAIANHFGAVSNPGSVSINDVTLSEGNAGTTTATFTVTRSGGTAAFNVNFATANGTATAGSDYVANSGTLSFGTGVNTRTVSVTVNGDTAFEPDETFFVNLSGATNGATITDSQGRGTIVNDDAGAVAGAVSINDVSVTEGNGGTTTATFTVTRTSGTAAFTVNYATADNTAQSGSDYVATSGTLSFASGVNTQTVSVTINGDTVFEPNETFFVNLSGATNGAAITDSQGQGTITNDDAAPPSDDFADSFTDTSSPFGTVSVGSSATGNLETVGDRDWFRVTLTAGTVVTIDVMGADSSSGTLADPLLRFYNSSGTQLSDDDDSGTGFDAQLSYVVTSSGTYYVAAGGYTDSYTGTYRVRVTAAVADDFADSLTDTSSPFGTVNVGSSATGNLETLGDRDWFRVTLSAGTYTFNLEGGDTSAGTLTDPYLRLYNSAGTLINQDDDAGVGLNSQLIVSVAAGTYYVEAGGYNDSHSGTYRVGVSSSAVPTDDFRDSLTDTTAPFGLVAINSSSTGNLETTGDRDWFQVQLTAGTHYVFKLEGTAGSGGTLPDPYLRLYNSTGTLLAENDDSNTLDSQLLFGATATGTYYLAAGAFNDSGTGTYRLTASASAVAIDFGLTGQGRWIEDAGLFNSDSTSDILLRNGNTGEVYTLLLQNGQVAGTGAVGVLSGAWQLAGTGFFNNDASSDVLLRNTATGEVNTWLVQNGQWAASGAVGILTGGWQLAGVGDFSGDGTTDVLLRNTITSEVNTWIVKNGQWSASGAVGILTGAWQLLATGDFNGDNIVDVLLHNTATDEVNAWIVRNGQWSASTAGVLSGSWQVRGTGDFNGNGTDDLLLHNLSSGEVAAWILQNGTWTASVSLGIFDTGSIPAAVGDFNNDGLSDVFWQNTTTGHAVGWLLTV